MYYFSSLLLLVHLCVNHSLHIHLVIIVHLLDEQGSHLQLWVVCSEVFNFKLSVITGVINEWM